MQYKTKKKTAYVTKHPTEIKLYSTNIKKNWLEHNSAYRVQLFVSATPFERDYCYKCNTL